MLKTLWRKVSRRLCSRMAEHTKDVGVLSLSKGSQKRCIRGVVFDMDGTLTEQVMDFSRVRRKLGLNPKDDILAYIESLKTDEERKAAFAVVDIEEQLGRDNLKLRIGCLQVLADVRSAGLRIGLLTRNCQRSVDALLAKLNDSDATGCGEVFSQVLTRDFHPPKPSAAPLLHICQRWSLPPTDVVIVGDGGDDLRCGANAGSLAVLINTKSNRESSYRGLANIIIDELPDLLPALRPYLTNEEV